MTGTVLITGADGYLGLAICRELLLTSALNIVLWVHAQDHREAGCRIAQLKRSLTPYRGRIEYAWGELRSPKPFQGVPGDSIIAIVHAAAITRFNVDREQAMEVNIKGTEKLLQWAGHCPALQSVMYISTLYASGLSAGRIPERPVAEPQFANFYEWSKWSAEQLLVQRFNHLPWKIVRPATVLADDPNGRLGQRNAIHTTLRLYKHGLMSLLPGDANTPIYFVTNHAVAKGSAQLLWEGDEHRVFHLCSDRDRTLTLGELIDCSYKTFLKDDLFRSRRILKPTFCDYRSFQLLAGETRRLSGKIVAQAVNSISPFARQLFVEKNFCTDAYAKSSACFQNPDPVTLLERVCLNL